MKVEDEDEDGDDVDVNGLCSGILGISLPQTS